MLARRGAGSELTRRSSGALLGAGALGGGSPVVEVRLSALRPVRDALLRPRVGWCLALVARAARTLRAALSAGAVVS